jgi:hypothetical protein
MAALPRRRLSDAVYRQLVQDALRRAGCKDYIDEATHAQFSAGIVKFGSAKFLLGTATFIGTDFTGSKVSFVRAQFSGSKADFSEVRTWSVPPVFDFAGSPPDGVVLPPAVVDGLATD